MNTVVIKKNIVSRSFLRLRETRIHTLFPGYLCLQRQTAILERLENLQPDFRGFYNKYFRVGNSPLGFPYIKPFIEHNPNSKNLWLNENVAGSYAPSSLRSDQPFRKVVKIEKKEYSLPKDHSAKALRYLLFNSKVSVIDLAILLYRDYGFVDDKFSILDLIEVFSYEFGYSQEGNVEFSDDFGTLYTLKGAASWDVDWLERI